MLKLKQVIIRKIESKFKDSKYVADIVKINDETGCGGLHGYTDINDPALDEYRDWINFHIRMMESMNASKMMRMLNSEIKMYIPHSRGDKRRAILPWGTK